MVKTTNFHNCGKAGLLLKVLPDLPGPAEIYRDKTSFIIIFNITKYPNLQILGNVNLRLYISQTLSRVIYSFYSIDSNIFSNAILTK